MASGSQKIVVIGNPSPLLEGVADLLQLAGYDVALSAGGPDAADVGGAPPPDLAILDLSEWLDSLELPQQILSMAPAPEVPILLLSFSGDDRIWHLQHVEGEGKSGRVEIYAHSLLGPNGLLDKVKGCLMNP
jgi:CheY-like chemotaxis protein